MRFHAAWPGVVAPRWVVLALVLAGVARLGHGEGQRLARAVAELFEGLLDVLDAHHAQDRKRQVRERGQHSRQVLVVRSQSVILPGAVPHAVHAVLGGGPVGPVSRISPGQWPAAPSGRSAGTRSAASSAPVFLSMDSRLSRAARAREVQPRGAVGEIVRDADGPHVDAPVPACGFDMLRASAAAPADARRPAGTPGAPSACSRRRTRGRGVAPWCPRCRRGSNVRRPRRAARGSRSAPGRGVFSSGCCGCSCADGGPA